MPTATDQLLRQALAHHQSGKFEEAENLYREVLAQDPDNVDALHLFSLLAAQFGHFQPALEMLDRAIAIAPDAAPIHTDRGNALVQLGRAEDAAAAYHRAIELNASDISAHANLADILRALGRPEEAVTAYRAAIALAPNIPGLHSNLGIILANLKRFEESIAAHQKAIAMDPSFPAPHANLSQAYSAAGRLAEAIDSARAAAKLAPEVAEAHNNLGTTLIQQGRVEEAIEAFRAALARNPNHVEAHDNLLLAQHNRVQGPKSILEEHRNWSRQHASKTAIAEATHRRAQRREPIKVAFLSPDFRDHPVGRLFQPFAEKHDKNKIELICYSDSPITDQLTEDLRATSGQWHNTFRLTDAQLAHLIRSHEIDILVDLAGHTAANRLRVLAQKPAPVQVTWLGYPNTTGLDSIDYRITDSIADPPGITDQYHTEKLLRLDPCFLCVKLPVANVSSDSTDRPFTFACFNNITKASPETLALWSKILHAIPNAKLLLKSRGLDDPGTAKYIRDRLTVANIPTDRIELLGRLAQPDHLNPYTRADAALDTYPYSGTATTIDALAAGLPVITLTGQTHAARVSTSLLSAAGLNQFIAPDIETYIKIAQDLAAAGLHTTEQRRALRDKVESSPLCNEKQFTQNLQELFEKIRPA